MLTSPIVRIKPNKYLPAPKFLPELLKRRQSTHIQHNIFLNSKIDFLLTDEILSIEYILSLVPGPQRPYDLPRRHRINIHDALPIVLDGFQNLGVAVSLHGVRQVEALGCLLEGLHVLQDQFFRVDVQGRPVLADQFGGLGEVEEAALHSGGCYDLD